MREMWNAKVFVDKLPKSCNDCVIDHCGEWCCLNGVEIDTWSYNETRPKECPLKSLADYTKQVRKEVCREIGKNIAVDKINGKLYARYEDLAKILDQRQGD